MIDHGRTQTDSFGSRLRKLRKGAKLSQAELAKELGFKTPGSISNAEKNKGSLDQNTLAQIAKVFKADIHWLVTGKAGPKCEFVAGSASEAVELLRPYALAYLGDVARGMTDMSDEIESTKMHPDLYESGKQPDERRIKMTNLRRDQAASYMAKIIDDLRKVGIVVDIDSFIVKGKRNEQDEKGN